MNKKFIMFLVLLGNAVCFSLKADPFGGGGGNIFDDLFKNIDFAQLEKDMQSILQEEKQTQPEKPTSQPSVPIGQGPSATPSKPAEVVKTDRKSLFLDPLVIEHDKKDPKAKARYKFPQIKIDSYKFHMNELVRLLKSIETKIDEARFFSPEFKEEFIRYKKNIDDIVIAQGLISDRKFYLRAFFLPQFKGLRTDIFNVIPTLEKLDIRISALAEKEEKKALQEPEPLFTFAKRPQIKLPPFESIKPTKSGMRKGSGKPKENKETKIEEVKQKELEFFPAPVIKTPQEEPRVKEVPES